MSAMSGRRITRQERRTVAPNLPGRKGAQAQICGHTFRRDEGEHVLAVDAFGLEDRSCAFHIRVFQPPRYVAHTPLGHDTRVTPCGSLPEKHLAVYPSWLCQAQRDDVLGVTQPVVCGEVGQMLGVKSKVAMTPRPQSVYS